MITFYDKNRQIIQLNVERVEVMKFFILVAVLLKVVTHSNGIEVLGILPFESISHFKIGHSIMKSLAEFSHNVTVVSPYPIKEEWHFYKDVSIAEDLLGFNSEGKDFMKFLCFVS